MTRTKGLGRTNTQIYTFGVLYKLASLFELSCTWFGSLLSNVPASCIWLTKVDPFLVVSEVLKPPSTQNNKKHLMGFHDGTTLNILVQVNCRR